jgi:hypothetical protein
MVTRLGGSMANVYGAISKRHREMTPVYLPIRSNRDYGGGGCKRVEEFFEDRIGIDKLIT